MTEETWRVKEINKIAGQQWWAIRSIFARRDNDTLQNTQNCFAWWQVEFGVRIGFDWIEKENAAFHENLAIAI
jgi:hypothetical protein